MWLPGEVTQAVCLEGTLSQESPEDSGMAEEKREETPVAKRVLQNMFGTKLGVHEPQRWG